MFKQEAQKSDFHILSYLIIIIYIGHNLENRSFYVNHAGVDKSILLTRVMCSNGFYE
jgi:hypothetical protein